MVSILYAFVHPDGEWRRERVQSVHEARRVAYLGERRGVLTPIRIDVEKYEQGRTRVETNWTREGEPFAVWVDEYMTRHPPDWYSGSERPTDADLMAFGPGDRVAVELDTGEQVTGEIKDPHHPNLNYPSRNGKGQVHLGLTLDRGATGPFHTANLVLTAYHGDKNPERRENRTIAEHHSIYPRDGSPRLEVVDIGAAEGSSPGANPRDAPNDGDE